MNKANDRMKPKYRPFRVLIIWKESMAICLRVDLRMRPGDQVLEWNGIQLTGKTFEEVQSILAQTQTVEEVEVVIRR